MSNSVDALLLARLSDCIAAQMGLYFPVERHADLQRGLSAAARRFGFADSAECARELIATPLSRAQIEILAEHLTVGETYFFREQKTFEALEQHLLPELLQARRNSGDRHLRLWSAGCCTGEEPYSLAITLSRMMPDLDDWQITILATDINPRFLQRAEDGIYGKWSLRATPPAARERYFARTADECFQLLPSIRQMVTFAPCNLVAEEDFTALHAGAMDIIFCRNVLMYLQREQAARVIGNFHGALLEGGWYVTSPSETSPLLASRFRTVSFPGAFLYRKQDIETPRPEKPRVRPAVAPVKAAPLSKTTVRAKTRVAPVQPTPVQPVQAELLKATAFADDLKAARRAADRGDLAAALEACDSLIATDKLDAASHYLRATILQEQGATNEAAAGLKRALYLDPNFVLAHFALGNLARQENQGAAAERHFSHALALLRDKEPAWVLPESEGVTAGALAELIVSLTQREKVES